MNSKSDLIVVNKTATITDSVEVLTLKCKVPFSEEWASDFENGSEDEDKVVCKAIDNNFIYLNLQIFIPEVSVLVKCEIGLLGWK